MAERAAGGRGGFAAKLCPKRRARYAETCARSTGQRAASAAGAIPPPHGAGWHGVRQGIRSLAAGRLSRVGYASGGSRKAGRRRGEAGGARHLWKPGEACLVCRDQDGRRY
ncbi:hypothetical protein RBY4I_1982 [Rhodobacterales bacterium Y4I]|nr:hypothetical protein RBY4I_1982 [Rhodobacterales bacterium Y4I]